VHVAQVIFYAPIISDKDAKAWFVVKGNVWTVT